MEKLGNTKIHFQENLEGTRFSLCSFGAARAPFLAAALLCCVMGLSHALLPLLLWV